MRLSDTIRRLTANSKRIALRNESHKKLLPTVRHCATLVPMKTRGDCETTGGRKTAKTAKFDLRIDPEVKTWLKRAAAKSNISAGELARQILRERFDQRRAK